MGKKMTSTSKAAGKMQQEASWKDEFLYIIRSTSSLGFAPNRELAAPPSCSCFSVPLQHAAAAAAAGGKRLGCCVSMTGYYWAPVPLCVSAPGSEQWQGSAEAPQVLVRASGKLLSSSWFAENIVSAHQEWSETQGRIIVKKKKKAKEFCFSISTSNLTEKGKRTGQQKPEMSSHRFTS